MDNQPNGGSVTEAAEVGGQTHETGRNTEHITLHIIIDRSATHKGTWAGTNSPQEKFAVLQHAAFRFLSILLTYMIAKWRNVSLLILRQSCVRMCPNKLKVVSIWHAE